MTEESWAKRNLVWLVLGGVFLVIMPVCACVIFGTVLYFVKSSGAGGPGPFGSVPVAITQVFYYDIATGQLFPGGVSEIPPIDTPTRSKLPNGEPAGVKANVFSCGRCKEGEWYVGYLETYLPAAKAAQIRMNDETDKMAAMPAPSPTGTAAAGAPGMPPMGPTPEDMMAISQGHLVATPVAVDKWYKQESPEGAALVNAAVTKCPDGKYPTQCFPGR